MQWWQANTKSTNTKYTIFKKLELYLMHFHLVLKGVPLTTRLVTRPSTKIVIDKLTKLTPSPFLTEKIWPVRHVLTSVWFVTRSDTLLVAVSSTDSAPSSAW